MNANFKISKTYSGEGIILNDQNAKGIIIKGGGHEKACGFTLKEEKIQEFKAFLKEETQDLSLIHI